MPRLTVPLELTVRPLYMCETNLKDYMRLAK